MDPTLDFASALARLRPTDILRLARDARPPASYLFATLLPERERTTYDVRSGSMTIRATMAGATGMDSPYAPGGGMSVSTFLERAAKLSIQVALTEEALRELQAIALQNLLVGTPNDDWLVDEMLNLLDAVVLQGLLDRDEWLRGQALVNGAIDWEYNGKTLAVDYGIPDDNKLTLRTNASNAAYGGSASAWWEDVRAARRILRGSFAGIMAHPDTLDAILYNPVNSMEVVAQSDDVYTLQRVVGTTERRSTDARDTVQVIAYGEEGEVIDPANPAQSLVVPFMPRGKVLFIGEARQRGYRAGEGSRRDPEADVELGYTHIAPTVEGGSVPGRWARIYRPEDAPWSIIAQGVENSLPVIESPSKIVVASTELPA